MIKIKTITVFTTGLLIALIILYILFRLAGESFWLTAFLMYMPQVFIAIPGLILLVISIMKKRIAESLLNAVAILLVVFLFMQFRIYIPHQISTTNAQKMTVLTYNIHAGLSGTSKINKVLRDSAADIIFLQEARKSSRGNHPDPVPEIEKAFTGWGMERGGERSELMIISRYTITSRKEIKLCDYRQCLVCDIDFNGRAIKLINVHFNTSENGKSLIRCGIRFTEYLDGTAEARKAQVSALVSLIESNEECCIVAGDFNSPPNSYVKRIMTDHLRDCFDEAGSGFGFTYSTVKPFWRIDYIFASKSFEVGECSPLNVRTSDHRPLKTVLFMPDHQNK